MNVVVIPCCWLAGLVVRQCWEAVAVLTGLSGLTAAEVAEADAHAAVTVGSAGNGAAAARGGRRRGGAEAGTETALQLKAKMKVGHVFHL